MGKEKIEYKPSDSFLLLAQIYGGVCGPYKYTGLLNEKISGGAKYALGKLVNKLVETSDLIEKYKQELIIKHGGTKEFGIKAENKQQVQAFFKEYNEYTTDLNKNKETVEFNKISIIDSKYIDIVSESDYSLALELLFTDGKED